MAPRGQFSMARDTQACVPAKIVVVGSAFGDADSADPRRSLLAPYWHACV